MNVALIFAKEDQNGFNRCTFPLLGRPVVVYPVLAALNAKKIDKCYISTSSQRIHHTLEGMAKVNYLIRENDFATIEEEFERALAQLDAKLNTIPENIVILFGNSPCVLPKMLDDALEAIEFDSNLDSVVSAVHRREFSATFACKLDDNGMLAHLSDSISFPIGYEFFPDYRFTVVRYSLFKNSVINKCSFPKCFGNHTKPFFQDEGLGDLDYVWQVPVFERWLRSRGFSENTVPYLPVQRSVALKGTSAPNFLPKHGSMSKKVFVSTVPFGSVDPKPISLLENCLGCEYVVNPIGRRLKEDELRNFLQDFDALIAGTEPITAQVMDNAPRLKLIARVGIGLDNVDLLAARERGIAVSYTPDAPAPAVAELAVGQMLNTVRGISVADRCIRGGVWERIMGERLANLTIGIIGTGRVGSRVLRHLQGFSPKRILVNDLKPDFNLYSLYHAEFCEKETIYREADIITLHVPMTRLTRGLISAREIEMMKKSVVLINTSRGGIINEADLYEALKAKRIAAAAIDVFEKEPYAGPLATLDNCFLTCHMGSCSKDCRSAMEIQATEEVVRFIRGEPLKSLVPETEYDLVL